MHFTTTELYRRNQHNLTDTDLKINISEKEDLITPAAAWWRAEHVHAVQCQSSAHFTPTFLIVVQNANKEMIVN